MRFPAPPYTLHALLPHHAHCTVYYRLVCSHAVTPAVGLHHTVPVIRVGCYHYVAVRCTSHHHAPVTRTLFGWLVLHGYVAVYTAPHTTLVRFCTRFAVPHGLRLFYRGSHTAARFVGYGLHVLRFTLVGSGCYVTRPLRTRVYTRYTFAHYLRSPFGSARTVVPIAVKFYRLPTVAFGSLPVGLRSRLRYAHTGYTVTVGYTRSVLRLPRVPGLICLPQLRMRLVHTRYVTCTYITHTGLVTVWLLRSGWLRLPVTHTVCCHGYRSTRLRYIHTTRTHTPHTPTTHAVTLWFTVPVDYTATRAGYGLPPTIRSGYVLPCLPAVTRFAVPVHIPGYYPCHTVEFPAVCYILVRGYTATGSFTVLYTPHAHFTVALHPPRSAIPVTVTVHHALVTVVYGLGLPPPSAAAVLPRFIAAFGYRRTRSTQFCGSHRLRGYRLPAATWFHARAAAHARLVHRSYAHGLPHRV